MPTDSTFSFKMNKKKHANQMDDHSYLKGLLKSTINLTLAELQSLIFHQT